MKEKEIQVQLNKENIRTIKLSRMIHKVKTKKKTDGNANLQVAEDSKKQERNTAPTRCIRTNKINSQTVRNRNRQVTGIPKHSLMRNMNQ